MRGTSKGWLLGMVVGSTVTALWALSMFATVQKNAYQDGYEAGGRDARSSFAELACKLPGEVDASCASLPNVPLCQYEDGTPEGCLRRDSDGTWYWVINMDGGS